MLDIFGNVDELKLETIVVCHSGGAEGSDSFFENEGLKYSITTKAYSYKTPNHKSNNKVEISEEDYQEGIKMIHKANRTLKRYNISKFMNLLARNWCQIKYSEQIFAIGVIINPNQKGSRGFYNKSSYEVVDGGTGYAVQMAIDQEKEVYVFDQILNKWFSWSYNSYRFLEVNKVVKITKNNFTGIGTRNINNNGINAIKELYKITFNNEEYNI